MKVKEIITEENYSNDDIINYSITYEIITPEDAEFGEPSERGFLEKNTQADFEDMISILEGTEPSEYPPSPSAWYTRTEVNVDYQTGAVESNSYHGKTDKDKKLMFEAWKAGN